MGDHYHVFWNCNIIQSYWQDITAEINEILGIELECNFKTIYLGIPPIKIKSKDKYLFSILLAASKKAITRKWMKKEPPTRSEWIEIVKDIYNMESLSFSLRQCTDQFFIYWEKWLLNLKTIGSGKESRTAGMD